MDDGGGGDNSDDDEGTLLTRNTEGGEISTGRGKRRSESRESTHTHTYAYGAGEEDGAIELSATPKQQQQQDYPLHGAMSRADEPLIAGRGTGGGDYVGAEGAVGDAAAQVLLSPRGGNAGAGAGADGGEEEEEEEGPSVFVWLLTLSAGLSGLLFGYDTGVISATLVSIDTSLSGRALTSLDKSVITSSTALLALLASPLSSVLADALGRRRVVLAADAAFAAGAALQAASTTVAGMVAGRAVVGAAVGAASFVTPLYIAEAAPAAHRGRLVTMNALFITLGQVVAYLVGWAFAEYGRRETGWRWMVGLGAAPALLQALLMLAMPETPRWLVRTGRAAEARAVIRRIAVGGGGLPWWWRRGGAKSVSSNSAAASAVRKADAVLRDIEVEVREEEEASRLRRRALPASGSSSPLWRRRWLDAWSELFAVRRNRRALAIACLLQGLQQLCGFNSLMYYSATIFTLVGFSAPTLTSLTVAATNFVFTVVALLVIDRVGRRHVLLYSIPLMVAGLLLSAYGFSFIKLSPASTSASSDESPSSSRGAAALLLVSIMVYVAAYAIGLGNVPWMQSELFALDVRSLGSGLATATNWAANFAVGLTFLPLMEALTPSWTFVLYAGVCAVGYALVRRVYPETSGLSLEEAAGLLEDERWGVR